MVCSRAVLGGAVAVLAFSGMLRAGDLNPPGGAVAPTLKTLVEVEPRTPISLATTPGDADSVYKIDKPGSYYLVGNVVGQAGKHGIEVASNDVTIDLMGFELDGAGTGFSGVHAGFGAGLENVAVHNGIVRAWIDGVHLGGVAGGRVVGVHAEAMLNNGITMGASMVARDCTSLGALGSGFIDQGGCRFVDCVAGGNDFSGFASQPESSFDGCVAEDNGANGFLGNFGCSWSGCTARQNEQIGFSATFASLIVDCVASGNGSHGIFVASQCTVRDNECNGNGTAVADGAGILSNGVDCRIEGNNCVGNDIGVDVAMSGNLVVRNSASGNTTTNYDANITNTTSNLSTAGAWDNLAY